MAIAKRISTRTIVRCDGTIGLGTFAASGNDVIRIAIHLLGPVAPALPSVETVFICTALQLVRTVLLSSSVDF